MSRKLARETVMQSFYQIEMNKLSEKEEISYFLQNSGVEEEFGYMNDMIDILFKNIKTIDDIISKNLVNWTLDRISLVDLSILRLAVCEIKYYDTVPIGVSINEAVNLAKKFSDEESASYINGVLGSIANKESKNE